MSAINVSVQVERAEEKEDAFDVTMEAGDKLWTVNRTYNDFLKFDSDLKRTAGDELATNEPLMKQLYVEENDKGLGTWSKYLRAVLQYPSLFGSAPMLEFFGADNLRAVLSGVGVSSDKTYSESKYADSEESGEDENPCAPDATPRRVLVLKDPSPVGGSAPPSSPVPATTTSDDPAALSILRSSLTEMLSVSATGTGQRSFLQVGLQPYKPDVEFKVVDLGRDGSSSPPVTAFKFEPGFASTCPTPPCTPIRSGMVSALSSPHPLNTDLSAMGTPVRIEFDTHCPVPANSPSGSDAGSVEDSGEVPSTNIPLPTQDELASRLADIAAAGGFAFEPFACEVVC